MVILVRMCAGAVQFTLMTFFGEWDRDMLATEAFGTPLFIVLLFISLIILVNLLVGTIQVCPRRPAIL